MTTSSATVDIPTAGTYSISAEDSSVSFKTRHMFGLGKVAGTFAVTGGDLVVADPVTASTLVARSGAASFDTGNAKRDKHVASADFLHAEEHPDLTYRSTSLTEDAGKWVLHGDLTVRGTSAPLDLTVTKLSNRGDTVTIDATGTADRYAHGITKAKGMAGRMLQLEIRAVANRV